jgi:hypothetical protein
VPNDNPSRHDHPHDHVPGTVLTEAARQSAAVVTHRRCVASPDRTVMATVPLCFLAYAKLDAPVVLLAIAVDITQAESARRLHVCDEWGDKTWEPWAV